MEIDSEMLSVAEKWFGFAQGERLKVFIEDGVQFVQEACAAGKKGILSFKPGKLSFHLNLVKGQ